MYIPDLKVEEVRAATDIVDVVSDYVRLKKRGSNYFGLCPFHNEKTPSFSVNPGMGIYKCFGCGAGGDVFQFLMRVENLTFPETVRTLADAAGITLPEDDGPSEDGSEVESIYAALRFAARFFYHSLTQTAAGKPALDYLEGRGMRPATIKHFGLGFAPDTWDALLSAGEDAGISAEILEKAGLIVPRKDGSGHYDRFRGRVIFPIFSHVGKVVGFGGRLLAADSDQPKYINSPDTRVYDKSRILYGLFQGKQAIRRGEEALLVEGYTDVVALHQAGVETAVASSGTSLTREQVKALGRYVKRLVLLFDADAAGASAALRGIDRVLEQGLAAYVVGLPSGDDPDSFVHSHGGEAFTDYVRKHRQDFVTFKYAEARRRGDLETPEGEAETMHAVLASIALMPDTLVQETYLRRASDVLGVPDIRLHEVLAEQRRVRQGRARRKEARASAKRNGDPRPGPPLPPAEAPPAEKELLDPLPEEKILLRLMLEFSIPMVEFVLSNMGLDEFTPGPARQMVEHFVGQYQDGAVHRQPFVDGTYGRAIQQLSAEVMVDRHEPSDNWERKRISVPRLNDDPYESAASAMTLLKLDRVNEAIQSHRELMYRAMQEGRDLKPLQQEMMGLHELRKQIQARAFLDESDV